MSTWILEPEDLQEVAPGVTDQKEVQARIEAHYLAQGTPVQWFEWEVDGSALVVIED